VRTAALGAPRGRVTTCARPCQWKAGACREEAPPGAASRAPWSAGASLHVSTGRARRPDVRSAKVERRAVRRQRRRFSTGPYPSSDTAPVQIQQSCTSGPLTTKDVTVALTEVVAQRAGHGDRVVGLRVEVPRPQVPIRCHQLARTVTFRRRSAASRERRMYSSRSIAPRTLSVRFSTSSRLGSQPSCHAEASD
jgi:hypothetical protein